MAPAGSDCEPSLAMAAKDIAIETETLLEPEKPVQMSSAEPLNGTKNHAESSAKFGQAMSSSSKVAASQISQTHGSDPHLEQLIKDSPFLDVSYPMTPYEWFKFVVMVSKIDCSCL